MRNYPQGVISKDLNSLCIEVEKRKDGGRDICNITSEPTITEKRKSCSPKSGTIIHAIPYQYKQSILKNNITSYPW